jgi:Ca2+-binding EF-hand superfamily protein
LSSYVLTLCVCENKHRWIFVAQVSLCRGEAQQQMSVAEGEDRTELRVSNLRERFPDRSEADIRAVLDAVGGHAGRATEALNAFADGPLADDSTVAIIRAITEMFEVMDGDGDGYIVQSEADVIAELLECAPGPFWSLLCKYDANNDGRISLNEFLAAAKGRLWQAFFHTEDSTSLLQEVTGAMDLLKKKRGALTLSKEYQK